MPLPESSYPGSSSFISFVTALPTASGRPFVFSRALAQASPRSYSDGPSASRVALLVDSAALSSAVQLFLGHNHIQIHADHILQSPDQNTGLFPEVWKVDVKTVLWDVR